MKLSKIVQNSEESQVSLYWKSVFQKKGLWKFGLGQNIIEPPYWSQSFTPMLTTVFYKQTRAKLEKKLNLNDEKNFFCASNYMFCTPAYIPSVIFKFIPSVGNFVT